MRYAKKFKKTFKKKVRKPYFTRKNQRGYNNRMRLYKEVKALKSIVNAEKKNFNLVVGSTSLGQVNGNLDGAYTADITPAPPQGAGDSQRNGDSIKLSTAIFNFQISQLSNTSQPIRYIIQVVQVLGTPQATSTFLNQFLLPNPFVVGQNVRDYNSIQDQDYRAQYRIIAQRKGIIKADTATGITQNKSIKLPLKFGNYGTHIKYAENTNTVASGQIMLLIRCDNGNFNASTTSTLGNVITSQVSTGLNMNRSFTYYYYDN